MGRKAKPTHLKELEGNRGRRPLNTLEPIVVGDLCAPPPWLAPDAQLIWAQVIAEAPAGLLKSLDSAVLVKWCVAYARFQRAYLKQEELNKGATLPDLTKSPKGHALQSPYVGIMNRASEIMIKTASELGFTPASRSRLNVTPHSPNDPAAKYFQ